MKKFTLDNIEDVLLTIITECPDDVFEELADFQCECEEMGNCYECWYRTITTYQTEQSLKSMNDESEEK